jgi:hypothetical protein
MSGSEPHDGFEVTPEPSPEELEALRLALARPQADDRGAWWREGVREAVEPEF